MTELEAITILLVEDDPGDQKLIKTSLKDQKIANDVYVAASGEEALDFLYHRGSYSNGSPRPDLILLDLNMPGMGGKEFLRRIKDDEHFKKIPVVILTTSDAERDIIDSYRLQASGYVNKPVTLAEFKEVMKKIEEYWFVLCKLPPRGC
ncbi:MAG: response regulator [Dehalococcoidia bacterium]|nr:MAG: response regulator [Dehalococcoidia bacterium]